MNSNYEQLGAFYLGRTVESSTGETTEQPLLYDSKDLTTHAVVVGMTGSGKTGLCISLLEEAAMDEIPAIVIDPKGDISNLLLMFPDLSPEEFRPWIDPAQAAREGKSVEQFAADTAKMWKAGLEDWGQGPERIKTLREKVDISIYTPGSNAGLPITVLKSFAAPDAAVLNDSDAFREKVQSATSGLLALLGIDADPIQSREFILISKILDKHWRNGKNLDVATLIGEIQSPPFKKIGVLELEKFFGEKDRMSLAMSLNNLLASPTFEAWMQGESLDVKKLLHTSTGKPRISVMSIAHLSDSERMFFVTILLNEMIAWMRSQAGTSSLRAILYMDEVFGYFPPQGNPPSKTPMLTLLKQARAFGLGCVLATQNPVDLDYKGLSNTGTWFLGRLQTERDKMRVLEGLEGASASTGAEFDRAKMEQTLAGLGKRVFLMNNVHEDQPAVFHTRWAMSYLRGPLTREHIETLMHDKKADAESATKESGVKDSIGTQTLPEPEPETLSDSAQKALPTSVDKVPPKRIKPPKGVREYFLSPQKRGTGSGQIVLRPMLIGTARLHYARVSYRIDEWITKRMLVQINAYNVDDAFLAPREISAELKLEKTPADSASFEPLPEELQISKNFTRWEKQFKNYLYREQQITILKCAELKEYSKLNEDAADFRSRLALSLKEKRDIAMEKLRKKYTSKLNALEKRIGKAQQKVDVETEQFQESSFNSVLTIGSSIFGALLGRKKLTKTNVNKASTSMKSVGRAAKQKGDITRAKESLESLKSEYEHLEAEFENETDQLRSEFSLDQLVFEQLQLGPRKTDISIKQFGVAWLPWFVDDSGFADPLF